eukprot:3931957-Amphidinium_carterae.1
MKPESGQPCASSWGLGKPLRNGLPKPQLLADGCRFQVSFVTRARKFALQNWREICPKTMTTET